MEPRKPTREEAALLRHLLRRDTAKALRPQVAKVLLTESSSAEEASWLLHLDDAVPRAEVPDGPLPGNDWAYDEDGMAVGAIVVWASAGHLSAVELSWVTDGPPPGWPTADRVRDPSR